MYLAWSCQRSKAVNGAQRVEGVMGRRHLRGVYDNLVKGKGALRFRFGPVQQTGSCMRQRCAWASRHDVVQHQR